MPKIALPQDQACPLPNGRYVLQIHKIAQSAPESGSSSDLYLRVTYRVLAGPCGSHERAGRLFTARYALNQASGWRVRRLLEACMIPPNEMPTVDTDQLVGKIILAVVAHDVVDGIQPGTRTRKVSDAWLETVQIPTCIVASEQPYTGLTAYCVNDDLLTVPNEVTEQIGRFLSVDVWACPRCGSVFCIRVRPVHGTSVPMCSGWAEPDMPKPPQA